MKLLFARLIVVFALVAGTLHAPAMAHGESAHHHADHGETSASDVLADGDYAPESLPDTGDNVHHHHGPAADAARTADMAHSLMAGGSLLPVHRTAALSSFSQAPPTEPPSA